MAVLEAQILGMHSIDAEFWRVCDIKGPISAVPRQKNVTSPYVTAVVDYRTDVVPSPLISTSVSSNLSVNGCIVWTLNFGAFVTRFSFLCPLARAKNRPLFHLS